MISVDDMQTQAGAPMASLTGSEWGILSAVAWRRAEGMSLAEIGAFLDRAETAPAATLLAAVQAIQSIRTKLRNATFRSDATALGDWVATRRAQILASRTTP